MATKKHSFADWMMAVRPWSFPASAMPVVVTLAYVYWTDVPGVDWLNGLWALANIVVFHAAGNTWSDYFDYKHKVDAADTFGVKTLTGGLFAPREIFRLSLALLSLALAGGIGLLARTGIPLLYIGIGGVACSLLYPPLKYRAWGDVVIFLSYALLPTLGTVYVTTLALDWKILLMAVPVGLITVAILHANNLRDISTDSRARIRTLAMNLGEKTSVVLYAIEVLLPFLWITGGVLAGLVPAWLLLAWLAFLPARGNVCIAGRYGREGSVAIAHLDEMTARLQLLFSLLLALSFVLARLLA